MSVPRIPVGPWFTERLLASLVMALMLVGLPLAWLAVGWGMPS